MVWRLKIEDCSGGLFRNLQTNMIFDIYISTHICILIHTYIYICVYIISWGHREHIHIYVDVCIGIHTYMCRDLQTNMIFDIYIYTYMYTYTHIYIYICVYNYILCIGGTWGHIHIYVYVCISTHICLDVYIEY